MDTVIKVKIGELDASLVERIKTFFHGNENAELTISFDDGQQKYYEALDRSLQQLEAGSGLITFESIDELEAYSNKKRA